MALLGGTIALLIYVIIIVLVFKLVKSAIKTLLIAILLFGIILAGTTYFVVKDLKDMQENFPDQPKLILLGDGEKLLAGFTAVDITSDNLRYLSDEELSKLSNYYVEEDYDTLLDINYKFFLFNLSMYDEVIAEGVEIQDIGESLVYLSGEKLTEALYSNNPIDTILNIVVDKIVEGQLESIPNSDQLTDEMIEELKNQVIENAKAELANTSPGQLKAMLLSLMLKEKIEKEGPSSIFMDLKNDEFKVYPETAVFKLIKFTPSRFIEGITSKMNI
ncbi:hypothetical protein C0585_02770 [Candidatus Woesearchaeota archaeon]|nr:MAG: hypothetical protein C0585_02770 [Candidatus Woesearchaeota archaeon]